MSSDAAPSAEPVCVLGFDVGSKRIGVAVGNTLTRSARPIAVVDVREREPDWSALQRLVDAWHPQRFIVGEPLTLDGGKQPMTRAARRFAQDAAQRFAVPATLVDERSSSREASSRFADQRRDGTARRRDADDIDALAAQIIIERWFERTP